MKRNIDPLVTDWLYLPQDQPRARQVKCDESNFSRVSIPHTNIELPYHNFTEKEYSFVSWYRRHFTVSTKARGKRRIFIDFEGVMLAATVYLNGKPLGPEHKGGYVPFSYDVTDLVQYGKDNVLAVRVDSNERKDTPPFGFLVDYMTFGGIYRDVSIRQTGRVYIDNIFARPLDALQKHKRLHTTAHVINTQSAEASISVTASIADAKGKIIGRATGSHQIAANSEMDIDLHIDGLKGINLWTPDAPNLYTVTVTIDGQDEISARVGFRSAEFREDGAFYLNGIVLKLRGLNRHQTYPYIGCAAPARLQQRDADILKNDLACNIVRTSHYPQSKYFLDRCDEIGLLVFEEIPGWQHIGNDAWQQISLNDVTQMIVRDRNRPGIILWGVRINESPDHHDFYVKTNALAHQLDPTRQTGGVRCMFGSELLEDVYTMNDFGYDLKPPEAPRYLNTEFCGHMYSTKTFDQEERVKQHAIHHAHVHNQIGGMASAGGIGWCAFDYNTHSVFGSGDRICHHGVMDIFRQPKIAAGFYASQIDRARRIVLEPATYWKMGDKGGGGVAPVLVFSNCEEIELFVGEVSHGRHKPRNDLYPNLPNPPFLIEKEFAIWGEAWQPARFVGFVKGKKVIERRMAEDGIPVHLVMEADDAVINADGADMTRISLKITDAFGNILPFAMQPVMLELSGEGVLVGDNPFPMPGGRGAVYVRSTTRPGRIIVKAHTARLKSQQVTVRTQRVK